MNNRSSKLSIGMALCFETILIYTAIVNVAFRQWKNLSLAMLAVVCLISPFIVTRIANQRNILLPSGFQTIALVFIFFAQFLGEIKNFYVVFWWWDLFLHAIFGSYAVIIALYLIKGIFEKRQEITEQRFRLFAVIVAFSVAIALGTLWEMFEFVGDYLFKTNMVKGGLEDTSMDLLAKIAAAFCTAIFYYFHGSKHKKR
ncbi:hypothetical protein [Desulfosporosinus nitroreducens]|uniref:Membrane-spanning protein n=1 Tax=Desulfosporosinus nitroreducens TaxID=2018668 RepID=A0ABT8QZ42_9FIRM|nr:hypothetical protein [Desulfosporosinus nitroreducens]MCO1603521.1 hypothetical protein [Desulfosporosinus nitroreducens]MDO0825915.1 hypothetical protein [Desulfosporosinus nitroreducens]